MVNRNLDTNLGHIVVFGNEKGGCGKSTAAMHAIVALLRLGYTVGSIDLDARQGTLTKYLSNRFSWVQRNSSNQPSPIHMPIEPALDVAPQDREAHESSFFFMAIEELTRTCDFVVVDTPGTYSHLNRLAHRFADTLVTPVNDSMIDMDLIVKVNSETLAIEGPSTYAKSVIDIRNARKKELGMETRWIVMRNRMNPLNLRSKRAIEEMLEDLSGRFGFRYIPGFSERIIFRDMFLKGLTILDMDNGETGKGMNMSQLAARQEVRLLVHAIVPEAMRIALVKRKKAVNQIKTA